MSHYDFHIKYTGSNLDNGQMSIKHLAPSLLALSDLLEIANTQVNGTNLKISLNIKANVEKGSFIVNLQVIQSLYEQITTLFNSDTASALSNLMGILTGIKDGFFYLLKKYKGRFPESAEKISENEIKITINNTVEIINSNVYNLYINHNAREAYKRLILPTLAEGIETFEIGNDKGEGEPYTINKEEANILINMPNPEDKIILETITEKAFSIITLTFKEDNKWRLSDGNSIINAIINDTAFIANIEQNKETFAKNDILKVKLKTLQTQTPNGLKTEYEVIEVLQHIKSYQQMEIPFTK